MRRRKVIVADDFNENDGKLVPPPSLFHHLVVNNVSPPVALRLWQYDFVGVSCVRRLVDTPVLAQLVSYACLSLCTSIGDQRRQ